MFATTNSFVQPSSSPFASQSVFGHTNNASGNPFAPKPSFGSQTFFAPETMFTGVTSTGMFGAAQFSSPFPSTTAFGAPSSPAFGSSMPAFGSSPSSFGVFVLIGPAFGFGSPFSLSSPFGSTTQQSLPAFGSGICSYATPLASPQFIFNFCTPAANAASTPSFGATSTSTNSLFGSPTFGISTGTAGVSNGAPVFGTGGAFGAPHQLFGASSTPPFSIGSTPDFGQSMPSFCSNPFGSHISPNIGNQPFAPSFGSTSFAQSTFGDQLGGSGVAPYKPTTEADSAQPTAKLESISAMPVYKDKSQEELRWEDAQLGAKGRSKPSGGTDFWFTSSQSNPAFGATSSPVNGLTGSQAFGSTKPASGVSNPPIFETGGAFGASTTPAFGPSSTPFSFGPSPTFGRSTPAFGSNPFGITTFGPQSFPFGGSKSTAQPSGGTGFNVSTAPASSSTFGR